MKNTHFKTLGSILLLVLYSCTSENINYEITDTGLTINAIVHGRFIPKDSLILESIKIIDVNSEHSYKPYIRIGGIGQPEINTEIIKLDEYLEGWFLLNNDDIALIFLSEHKKAIYIKTKLKPPTPVKIISKIEPSTSPDHRKNFSILLGTNNPTHIKELMEDNWGQVTIDK